jgi:hypothetical protein
MSVSPFMLSGYRQIETTNEIGHDAMALSARQIIEISTSRFFPNKRAMDSNPVYSKSSVRRKNRERAR